MICAKNCTYLHILPLILVYFVLENVHFVLENNISLAVGTMHECESVAYIYITDLL